VERGRQELTGEQALAVLEFFAGRKRKREALQIKIRDMVIALPSALWAATAVPKPAQAPSFLGLPDDKTQSFGTITKH
jgi:hypothetical protein